MRKVKGRNWKAEGKREKDCLKSLVLAWNPEPEDSYASFLGIWEKKWMLISEGGPTEGWEMQSGFWLSMKI